MYCIILSFVLIFAKESTQINTSLYEYRKHKKRKCETGILELCILSTIDKKPKYSSEILEGLKRIQTTGGRRNPLPLTYPAQKRTIT